MSSNREVWAVPDEQAADSRPLLRCYQIHRHFYFLSSIRQKSAVFCVSDSPNTADFDSKQTDCSLSAPSLIDLSPSEDHLFDERAGGLKQKPTNKTLREPKAKLDPHPQWSETTDSMLQFARFSTGSIGV